MAISIRYFPIHMYNMAMMLNGMMEKQCRYKCNVQHSNAIMLVHFTVYH